MALSSFKQPDLGVNSFIHVIRCTQEIGIYINNALFLEMHLFKKGFINCAVAIFLARHE